MPSRPVFDGREEASVLTNWKVTAVVCGFFFAMGGVYFEQHNMSDKLRVIESRQLVEQEQREEIKIELAKLTVRIDEQLLRGKVAKGE